MHVFYRACQGLLFRLESYIFIDNFELNINSITSYFTFFSITITSYTNIVTQSYINHTKTRNTQKSFIKYNQDYIHTLKFIESILYH